MGRSNHPASGAAAASGARADVSKKSRRFMEVISDQWYQAGYAVGMNAARCMIVALCFAPTLLAQQYTISTIAGGGSAPSAVSASSVRLPISGGIASAVDGQVYFVSENSVMKVDASGILTR